MNKELIKLAEESGLCKAFYYLGKDNNFVFEKLISISDDCTIPVEKFAELLIKECLKQVREEVQYQFDFDVADRISNTVLTHFGITK